MIIAKLKSPIVRLLESHLTGYRGDIMGQALDDIKRLERELAEAVDTIKRFADCVESLAFEMEPPNKFTPRFVQMAIEARAFLQRLDGK